MYVCYDHLQFFSPVLTILYFNIEAYDMVIVMNIYFNLKICIFVGFLIRYYKELFVSATEGM